MSKEMTCISKALSNTERSQAPTQIDGVGFETAAPSWMTGSRGAGATEARPSSNNSEKSSCKSFASKFNQKMARSRKSLKDLLKSTSFLSKKSEKFNTLGAGSRNLACLSLAFKYSRCPFIRFFPAINPEIQASALSMFGLSPTSLTSPRNVVNLSRGFVKRLSLTVIHSSEEKALNNSTWGHLQGLELHIHLGLCWRGQHVLLDLLHTSDDIPFLLIKPHLPMVVGKSMVCSACCGKESSLAKKRGRVRQARPSERRRTAG